MFQDIKTFVIFVGYPRSGHSLIGACLDAHPNAVISHELDALSLLKQGISRVDLFNRILEKSKSFSESGNMWSGYSYQVPEMWQGKHQGLSVIGDKRGGTSVKHVAENPELIEIAKKIAPQLRIIHVTRNPFDCISTSIRNREKAQNRKFRKADLLRKSGHFFRKAKTIQHLIEREEQIIYTLPHEGFLSDPIQHLSRLCEFIGLHPEEEYLSACNSIVWDKPSESRQKIDLWDSETIDEVQRMINKYNFLSHYNFSSN